MNDTITETAKNAAVKAICESDPRWVWMSEQQREVWRKNCHATSEFTVAAKAAQLAIDATGAELFREALTEITKDDCGFGINRGVRIAKATLDSASKKESLLRFMKTPEQLHAEQSALPPMREYFVVHERPKGSYIWTELHKTESAESANTIAKKRVDNKARPPCDCIVTSHKLPRMPHPDTEAPYAVLADGDTTYMGTNLK